MVVSAVKSLGEALHSFIFTVAAKQEKRELELRPLLKAARYLNSVNTCDNVSVSLVCKSMNVEPAFCPLQ